MADFRTHVTTSSVLGIGYAGMGAVMGLPIETCVVAGGMCGIAGMLPDLDSDSGVPLREAMAFAAAVVPMVLMDRLELLGLPHDMLVLITACLYFAIRFAGSSLLSSLTVHRGMFHSLPAALIFAGVTFLLFSCTDVTLRYYRAGGVLAGVLSHLLLDELYSIEWRGGRWRFKSSFGTALKLFGSNPYANFSTYAKLAIVAVMITGEPAVVEMLAERNPRLAERLQRVRGYEQLVVDRLKTVGGEIAQQTQSLTASAAQLPPTRAMTPVPNVVPPATTIPGGWMPNRSPQPNYSPPQPAAAPAGGFAPNTGGTPWGTARRPGIGVN